MINKQESIKGGLTGIFLGAVLGSIIPGIGPVVGAVVLGGIGAASGNRGYLNNVIGIRAREIEQEPQLPSIAHDTNRGTITDSYKRMNTLPRIQHQNTPVLPNSRSSCSNRLSQKVVTWGVNKALEQGEKSFTSEEKKALTQLNADEKEKMSNFLDNLLATSALNSESQAMPQVNLSPRI